MKPYESLSLPPTLEGFIARRTYPHINTYHSIKVIAANAYIQGMNDTIDALYQQTGLPPTEGA